MQNQIKKRDPQIYSVYLKPDDRSADASTFNAINCREAREMAQVIREMSTTVIDGRPNRRPIRFFAATIVGNRISFKALVDELDVSPVFPRSLSETTLTTGKVSELIQEHIRPDIDAAYVIAVGSKEEGSLLMRVILKKLFFRDVPQPQIDVMIEPGWKINMGTGFFRSINNSENPTT